MLVDAAVACDAAASSDAVLALRGGRNGCNGASQV